jgi:hypothetical protein
LLVLGNRQEIVDRLIQFQEALRDRIIASRASTNLHDVQRRSAADTIYAIDEVVEPVVQDLCDDWSRTTPLILIAEGVVSRDAAGKTVEGFQIFPRGAREEDALVRLIIDPIDGTRMLMYDKRSAWTLAGVAANKGTGTSLRDIEVSVMTELPTSKMGQADVLWAVAGGGAQGRRVDLASGKSRPLALIPSRASTIDHGFASVSNFFPGTKMLASELMERIAEALIPAGDLHGATVFEDQYISTAGQFHELIVGHDRFNADLRPVFYATGGMPEGMCCHPYDCAALLIAEEAGVIVTDPVGERLNAPLDCTTGVSWLGYANPGLRAAIEPVVQRFLKDRQKTESR